MSEHLPGGSALNDLLRECFRLNRGLVDAARRLTDGSGITGAQWGVLAAFAQDDETGTVAAAARRMGLARQSVQRVADVLAEQQLVKYLPSPDDQRAKRVELTARGVELLSELEQRQQQWVANIAADCSDSEINSALKLIHDIRERVSVDP